MNMFQKLSNKISISKFFELKNWLFLRCRLMLQRFLRMVSGYTRKRYYNLLEVLAKQEAELKPQIQNGKKNFKLAWRVFLLKTFQNMLELFVIIVFDPAESFNILKKRDEFAVCRVSFIEYRLYSKKMKLFSLGGVSAVVMLSLLISFFTSFILPYWQRALAATKYWTQTQWSGGAVGNNCSIPNTCPGDPDPGWTKYSTSSNISARSEPGDLTIASAILSLDTTDTDFASGTLSSGLQISGTATSASIILQVPE